MPDNDVIRNNVESAKIAGMMKRAGISDKETRIFMAQARGVAEYFNLELDKVAAVMLKSMLEAGSED